MSSYREWVQALLREHRRGRRFGVRCSGCWACDVLPGVSESDRQRCKDLSRGAPGSVGGFDGHHVLPKQLLKREVESRVPFVVPVLERPGVAFRDERDPAREAVFEKRQFRTMAHVLYDVRIGVPLRRWHHDQWEARRLSVPRGMLPVGVEEIAAELGLEWWLDRMFGEAGNR